MIGQKYYGYGDAFIEYADKNNKGNLTYELICKNIIVSTKPSPPPLAYFERPIEKKNKITDYFSCLFKKTKSKEKTELSPKVRHSNTIGIECMKIIDEMEEVIDSIQNKYFENWVFEKKHLAWIFNPN